MKQHLIRRLALTLILSWAAAVLAQTDTARLTGTVTDQLSAVVPQATVTLTNLGTGRVSTTESGNDGAYTLTALPPGQYKVEVKKASFRPVTQTITLQVSQVAALNFTLQPGAISETVEVHADVPIVESASSNISDTIQGKQVTELPLNGRNFTQLALLSPGVTRSFYGSNASGVNGNAETWRNGETGGAALSVNGLRPQANNFIYDGTDNNESLDNNIIFFPPAEAIQEFQVQTNIAPAEFGRAGGAIVNTTTRSGANALHGSAFDFLRNSFFDARPTNLYETNPKQVPFKRNQFGGTIGGPIKHNKLFFFGDFQGRREDQPLNPETATVPTDLMRKGDFSELLGSSYPTVPAYSICPNLYSIDPGTNKPVVLSQYAGKGYIYNPQTCLPFSGNVIPSDQINQAGLKYLQAFPEPSRSGIQQNYVGHRRDIRHFNDFDARLDYNISEKDQLFGRFSFGQDYFDRTPRLATLPSGFASGHNFSHTRGLSIGETHIFSTNVISELRVGFSRDFYGYLPPFGATPVSANLGIVNANRNALLGGGALIGGWNSEIEYTGDYGDYFVPQNTYQVNDSISVIHNRHTFKFGVNLIRRQVNLFNPIAGKGYFYIGDGTGATTGYEVSELLAGFMWRYQIGAQNGMYGTRNWETGYYAQDDWRVSNRLTLNLGIRYDLYTNPSEVNNRQAAYDLSTGTMLLAGQNGVSGSIINTDKTDFAPRIGFAYSLTGDGKTVLRGGYGVFYFLDRGGIYNQLAEQVPFGGSANYAFSSGYRITFSGQAPMGNGLTGSMNNQLATAALPAPGASGVDVNHPTNVDLLAPIRDNKTSNVQQWDLQLQRELGSNSSLSLAYVGTKGTHLMTYVNLNQQELNSASGTKPYPNLGNVVLEGAIGNSSYNALQARFNRRLTNGLQYNVAYTWSHTIDDSNGAFGMQNTGDRIFPSNLAANRGNSDQDQRHFFSLSGIYELPFGHGKRFGAGIGSAANALFGGWQFNTIVTLSTGTPFDVNCGGSPSNRCDLVGSASIIGGITGTWFNTQAFAKPPANADGVWTRIGTTPRNYLHGPGTRTWDASLFKDFTLTERFKLQFRTQAYNLTNSPQWTNPDSNIYDGNFGKITGTRQYSERQLEFALRLTF